MPRELKDDLLTLRLCCVVAVLFTCRMLSADQPVARLCEPWKSDYLGNDAAGKHVIGLWKFDDPKIEDASGRGHVGTLRGAKLSPGGRFGACLETFCGWPVEDKEHRLLVENRPDLSPQGPFTLELWLKPKPELNADYPQAFLLDKKYVAPTDYQLILGPPDPTDARTLQVALGFGADSEIWYARPAKFPPGVWRHVAFTYDGKGEGRFYLDGVPWGSKRVEGRRSIAAGTHPLSIGDRIGSRYGGFPGFIDQVRLSNIVLEFCSARVERISERACFVRMESPALLRFAVTNLARRPSASAEISISLNGLAEKTTKLTSLVPGKPVTVDYPVDTSLRPDAYRVLARLSVAGPEPYRSQEEFSLRIVPRQPPHRFPVLMWGVGSPDGVLKEMERLKQIGFNHVLGLTADNQKIWEAGKPIAADKPETVAQTKHMLDEALANDMTIVASLSPASTLFDQPEFQRVDRQGQPLKVKLHDVCGLIPRIQTFCYNVGASMAQTYGDFPAFGAAMLHTEVRDRAELCFHPRDQEAFRKASGIDVPPEARSHWGLPYRKIHGFPTDHVIPDDYPLYVFYRWYWKSGDGWNGLNTALHRGLKSTGRRDFWTYHDPAVRVASVYGSGGEADTLSQWTYSYPDPIRIAVATDELLAMAGGAATKQNVMKMTQIIWYRTGTAPIPKTPADVLPYRARWEQEQPEAPFITIAPMHLREAFWTKIARPIKGIMYHGWQSLVPTEPPSGYCFTHPETQHELARLVREVIRPLGPTLLQTPAAKSDVAFLESFASEMFAQRGTYGWSGSWLGDAYHVLLYAHLQPEIVFDETIATRGLDGFRVLVMTDCDVITQSMAERIKAFQARGGIIVGDDRITPAIRPDIHLTPYQRTGRPDKDKAALQAIAAELRRQLDGRYSRYVDCSNPEVIPYLRRHRQTDYIFLVNDRREFGQYVGQHGIVMENGLPSQAVVAIHRPAGFVYDLLGGRQLAARQQSGRLLIDSNLGPCDGRLWMLSPKAIDGVRIQAPAMIARGNRASCRIEVLDPDGRPLEAVVPLQVTIRDSESRSADLSGYYAAVNGTAEIPLDIAQNDPLGVWQIEVRELASSRTAVRSFRVPGPSPWPPASKPLPKELGNSVQPKG
jgi:hypothetical protein